MQKFVVPTNSRDSQLSNGALVRRILFVPVTIERRAGVGLGLSIAGGLSSVPYKDNDRGIFVSKLVENGLAAQSGLQLNDKILSVRILSLMI
ncbi:leucine rich repeat containing [Cichlidogyrus casuarinus]|uniref:Leucine rich repeat containing n=1 Tax=Cichlidogyrus casuarinus TaxID=1844966 RepID=A0ABD2PZ19_9PLAT